MTRIILFRSYDNVLKYHITHINQNISKVCKIHVHEFTDSSSIMNSNTYNTRTDIYCFI